MLLVKLVINENLNTNSSLMCYFQATEATVPETEVDSVSPCGSLMEPRCPAGIEFGKWEIKTWYSSPFPQEYARYWF